MRALLHVSLAAVLPIYAASAQLVDTINLAVNPGVTGNRTCALLRDTSHPADSKNVDLLIRLTDTLRSSADVKTDADLAVALADRELGGIEPGQSGRRFSAKTADVAGKILRITTAGDNQFLCAIGMRPSLATPAQDKAVDVAVDDRFMMVTGVEFSSADGFQNKQLRVPVTTAWNVEAAHSHIPSIPVAWLVRAVSFGHNPGTGIRTQPINLHLTLQALGEAGSIIRPESFDGCLPNVATYVPARDTLSTNTAIMQAGCRIRIVNRVSDSLFRLTSYAMTHDAVRTDTTVTTALTWRFSGLTRFEVELPNERGILVGPAAMWAFETNPNGPSVRSIGRVNQYGASLRQKDADGHESFEFLVLKGMIDVFPRVISTEYVNPLSPSDTATRTTAVLGPTQRVKGWSFRALFSPARGFYIRGSARYHSGYPDLATIAVLKELDVAAALKAIGIKIN